MSGELDDGYGGSEFVCFVQDDCVLSDVSFSSFLSLPLFSSLLIMV